MSIVAIQDSLVKTSLVQHTQAKGEDVGRGQESAMQATLREQERQEDQVVLRSREAEQNGVRDEEGNRDRRGRKEREEGERVQRREEEDEEDDSPRARMRCINIVV